jgi:hypothetical protein
LKSIFRKIILSFFFAGIVWLWSPIPFLAWWSLFYAVLLVFALLDSIGRRIPFQELITSMTAIQLLIGPFLEYFVFKIKILGGMSIPPVEYFQFVLPCTVFLNLGLSLFYPKADLELKLFELLSSRKKYIERQGIFLIVIGYVGYAMLQLLPSMNIEFIIYLLSFCRFIGFLYLWGSGSKYTPWAFFLVIIPFVIEAINQTILVNLIVYFTILMTFYFMKHHMPRMRIYLIFLVLGTLLVTLQSVKSSVRKTVTKESFEGNTSALFLENAYKQINKMKSADLRTVGGMVNVRVNQGWILSDIIDHLQRNPYKISTKYFTRELLGIFLPRFLYPNKPIVGDHKKFKEYAGWKLSKKVAMSVGLMGDGYGNFGYWGGILYCFSFGLLLGLLFFWWNHIGQIYPTLLLWGMLIFFYCMRAGDETYIIMNWIIKSAAFVFLYYLIFERNNRIHKFIQSTPV